MDAYFNKEPQNFFLVLYDGCSFFKQGLVALWPYLLLFALLTFASHLLNYAGSAFWLDKGVVGGHMTFHSILKALSGHHVSWYFPLVLSTFMTFLQYLIACAMLIALHGYLGGKLLRHGEALKQLLRRFGQLIALVVVGSMMIYAGLLFMFVPGIFVIVFLYQAKLLLLIDSVPFHRAIKESTQMVWGTGWWRSFGVFVLAVAAFLGYLMLLFYLLRVFNGRGEWVMYGVYAATSIFSALLTMLVVCWQLALFHDLKLRWMMPESV